MPFADVSIWHSQKYVDTWTLHSYVIYMRFQLFLSNWPLQYPWKKLLPELSATEEICWSIENVGLTPQSPDPNPIKQIWGELENKLNRSIVHSKESLAEGMG